jgi:metal-responsive CopG/Arc/MetJ family transcriptional regulator
MNIQLVKNMVMRRKVLVTIYLDKADVEALNKLAKENGTTGRSDLVRQIVRRYIQRHTRSS